MSPLLTWALVIGTASLFIISDSLSAHWGKTGNIYSIIIMIFIAPLGYLFFGILNKKMSLAASSVLVNLMIIAGGVLVGIFYFKEILTLKQIIGLLFGAVAIVLLS